MSSLRHAAVAAALLVLVSLSAAAAPQTIVIPDGTEIHFKLNQPINTANAKDLKVAWTFSTGVLRGHEGRSRLDDSPRPAPRQKHGADPTGIHGPGEETASRPCARFRPDASARVPVRRGAAPDEGRVSG